jgi:hypothetical protein
MKVEVNVKMKTCPEAGTKFMLTCGPSDTVAGVKERLAGLQMIPFPDQDLVLDGEVLPDASKLAKCGVMDGASLEFVVKATAATLVEQLSDLLQARDLSTDELGLLYCYKHGVAINQALKMIGIEGKLQDFLKDSKQFLLEGGRASLVREDTTMKPFSVVDEVVAILKANAGAMDIKDLCTKFSQKFNVHMSSLVGKPADFLSKEKDLFVLSGRGAVSLKSMLAEQASTAKASETSLLTAEPPGLGEDNQALEEAWTPDNEQYLELHNRVSCRSFNSKAVQFLGDVVDLVTENIFLTVDHHIKGGSVGKGTAINGCADAEVVFFLQGLPPNQHGKWLPPLLKSVTGILTEQLVSKHDVERIQAGDDSVQVRMKDFTVELRFSPVFESYAKTLEIMGGQSLDARKLYRPGLAKEMAQFIARQPPQVKMTIRLMKWWRDQQEWTTELSRPADDILELTVVYSAVQTKPADQQMAIANVMSLLSRFDELRIVWSNFYTKDEVWTPLLRQRPLLMDPANPFVNVADPQSFDASELMELARTTHFFW